MLDLQSPLRPMPGLDPKQAPGHPCGTGRNPAWCGQRARTLGLLRHALFVAPKDSYDLWRRLLLRWKHRPPLPT